MRSFIPALIGLATVAVAQNSTESCISAYVSCYDFDTSNNNVCSSNGAACKDSCSTANSNCLSSGVSSDVCSQRYATCLGATSSTNTSISCISEVIPCYESSAHDDTHVCDSKITNCKDACTAINDICLSIGDDDSAVCNSLYSACLGADKVTTPSTSCISQAETCYNNNTADNTCGANTATCKQTCGVLKDACMTSGDDSQCESAYLSCLGSDNPGTSSVNCISEAETCYQSGEDDNVCDADNAQCKDFCSNVYDTCNSSGDNSTDAACLSYYSSCLGSSKVSDSSIDCVAATEACYLNGTLSDAQCDTKNALCKTQCSREYSTCLSSGDESVDGQCASLYSSCLGSTKLTTSSVDCVTRNEQCYLNGTADNTCDSDNAVCKSVCARATDTCLSSNDSSVAIGCYDWYNECLGATNVSSTSSINCVSDATECFLYGTADNNCSASTATCKSACSRTYDTCLSSGDESIKDGCLLNYDSCLGATPQAEEAASSINCIERYTTCWSSGIAENECSAQNAQCKNTCSQLLDSCNSSGDNSTSAQCQGVYNSCLGSIATSLVDYEPLDCAARSKQCSANGTASNECDRQTASCKNACATTLDTCLTSGSSDSAACNHLYLICLDSSSYTATSIPASLKPTSTRASISITNSANVTTGYTAPTAAANGTLVDAVSASANVTSAVTSSAGFAQPTAGASSGFGATTTASRVGAFVPAPYQNGSSVSSEIIGSDKTTKTASVESTVYVTDVVKTTVTTCPVGQTLTTAGKTTVLTTPSVITSTYTVQSTVSTTVAVTETASKPASSPVNAETTQVATTESTVYVTDVVKTTVTTCPVGQTLTTAGKTTVLTTPSVITSTYTVQSTVSTTVAITQTASNSASSPVNGETASKSPSSSVNGETASKSASSPINAETTSAPVAGHVAIPSTVILYSTAVLTVTSCGSEVTNCPARLTGLSTSLVPTGITVSKVWSRTSAAPVSSEAGAASGSASASSVESTVIVTDVVKSTVTTCPVGHTLTTSGSTIVLTTPSAVTSYETVFVKSTVPVSGTSVSASSPVAAVPASSKATSAVQSASQGSAPASSVPASSAPASSAPAGSAPASSVPAESSTAQSTPAGSALAASASSPVAAVPQSSAPASSVPAGSAPAASASSPVAAVPEASAPVSAAPVVPATAPYGLTNGTMTVSFATGSGAVGTSSTKATSTQAPLSTYTGAANKAGVAGLAGAAAIFAFLL